MMLRTASGLLVLAMLVSSQSGLRAQSLPGPSALSPGPTVTAPQQPESYLATRTRLIDAVRKAFGEEMAREKAGDCKDASSTYGAVTCLSKEGQITTANYEAMTQNLRALLVLADTQSSRSPAGTAGKEPTQAQAAEYDALQQSWGVYRKSVDGAAYDQFKGGTEAPVANALADQMVVRSHMKELASIYDFLLGNH